MKRLFSILILALSTVVLLTACGGGGGGGDTPTPSGGNTPDITVTDSVAPSDDLQIPFGNITLGFTLDKTVTITNDGTADLVVGTIGSGDSLAAPFSKTTDGCSGQIIASGGSCTLTIRFAPIDAVASSDSFDIPSDDPDENPVTVSVSGTGTASSVPDITVTDSAAPNNDLKIPFGGVMVGATAIRTVTVSNSGSANLTIGTIIPPASPFGIVDADACSGQTLAPAASCTMTVQMTPSAVGNFSSSIVIPSNDPDENPVTVSVSGSGIAAPTPNISVTPTSIQFGEYCPGTQADDVVTIKNTGIANLSITSITKTGSSAFSQTNACPTSLTPGDSCDVTVHFVASPPSGNRTGTLVINSNDPDTPTTYVNLSGTVLSSTHPDCIGK